MKKAFCAFIPGAWNKYPAVTPPRGALLRVEIKREGLGAYRRTCCRFSGTQLIDLDTRKPISVPPGFSVWCSQW